MMKRLFFVLLAISLFGTLHSQNVYERRTRGYENEVIRNSRPLRQLGDNELKFNLITAIAGMPEINYERLVEDNVGLGVAFAFSLETPEQMRLRTMIMPYQRTYFGSKKASGFFIEANLGIVNEAKNEYVYNYDYHWDDSYVSDYSWHAGFGAAVGFKMLNRNGIIGEFYFGVGRLFGNSEVEAYPRIGITIGKRF